jgi:hypothetical protein
LTEPLQGASFGTSRFRSPQRFVPRRIHFIPHASRIRSAIHVDHRRTEHSLLQNHFLPQQRADSSGPLCVLLHSARRDTWHGSAIESWLPKWDRLLVIASIIVMERIYTYRYAVSQKAIFGRDIIANIVNLDAYSWPRRCASGDFD